MCKKIIKLRYVQRCIYSQNLSWNNYKSIISKGDKAYEKERLDFIHRPLHCLESTFKTSEMDLYHQIQASSITLPNSQFKHQLWTRTKISANPQVAKTKKKKNIYIYISNTVLTLYILQWKLKHHTWIITKSNKTFHGLRIQHCMEYD